MKTLYLIRHAKSDWKPNLTDFERPLNKRGFRDAPFMAKKLKELNFNPNVIVCSNAKRTTSTAKLICSEINYPEKEIIFDPTVYESSLENLIYLISQFPNTESEIGLIGHNPSITLIYNYLTEKYIGNMPTCSIVKVELEIDNWNEIIKGIGIQKFYIYPKLFS